MASLSQKTLTPLEIQFRQAEMLLHEGHLKEAAQACQQLVMENPADPDGYFLMAKLFLQVQNQDKAIEHLSKAISLSSRARPNYHFVRGHIYLMQGKNQEALNDLLLTSNLNNQDATTQLLLGAAYTGLGQIPEARASLQRAAALGLSAEANEQLGMLLQGEGKLEEAMELFESLIKEKPDYAMGYVHRGNLRLEMNDLAGAKEDAEKAVKLEAGLERGWLLLGLVQFAQGDFQGAAASANQSVALRPSILQNWHFLASSYAQMGQAENALAVYKEVLNRDPKDTMALNYLPASLMALGRVDEAREYLDMALAAEPENPILLHFDAASRGERLPTASNDYVRIVFDGYADQFDVSLQEKLHYKTPEILAQRLREVMGVDENETASLSLLDLGCGTGLGAVALEKLTGRRIGIDLSPRMLEKALARDLYAGLEVAEIVEFMDRHEESFDLIAAVDVFVYIGDLDPVFASAAKRINKGGYFAFSVEGDDAADGFTLRNSGRFAHSATYLRQLAAKHGYKVNLLEASTIRFEAGKPVEGYIAVLSRD